VICDHKDCESTDASPVELRRFNRDNVFVEAWTYHFSPEQRRQLLSLKTSRTLPPAEWFEEANRL